MFSLILRWVFKNSLKLQINRRNTVYFKAMVQCVCCLWNSLEQERENDRAAGGFVVWVCGH
jgi:hypothetical protein